MVFGRKSFYVQAECREITVEYPADVTLNDPPGTPPGSITSGDDAKALLAAGNAYYTSGALLEIVNRSASRRLSVANDQTPFAVLVHCSDSRESGSVIFNRGIGDIFNIVTAGEVIYGVNYDRATGAVTSDDIQMDVGAVGSLEFALLNFPPSALIVMGHTSCGVLAAAYNYYINNLDPLPGTGAYPQYPDSPFLEGTSLGYSVTGCYEAVSMAISNGEGIDSAARYQVESTIKRFQSASSVVRNFIASRSNIDPHLDFSLVKTYGAMYDVQTGSVTFGEFDAAARKVIWDCPVPKMLAIPIPNVVALPQMPLSGSVTLNGPMASGQIGSQIMIQSQGDVSPYLFTVTGTDEQGRATSEDVIGPGGVSGSVYNGLVLVTNSAWGHPYYTYLVDKTATADNYTEPEQYLNRWGPHCPWYSSDQWGGPASCAYLTAEGDLIYPYKADLSAYDLPQTAAPGGGILIYSWSGQIKWVWTIPPAWGWMPHHDICPISGVNAGLNKGDILLVAMRSNPPPWDGDEGTSDGIIQIRPNYSVSPTGEAQLIQTWSVIDHISTIPDQTTSFWTGGPQGSPAQPDWNHFNSVFLTPTDRVYISSRKWNEFYVIDWPLPASGAPPMINPTGLLYRWGNPASYNSPGGSEYAALDAPHCVSEIPQGYPGARNAILFNNEKNQILEITNISDSAGNYPLPTPPSPFGPPGPCLNLCPDVDIVYPLPYEESSPIQSSTFRLPNGHTYINSHLAGKLFEITPNQDTVWSLELGSWSVTRSNQYETDYIQQISRKTYTRGKFATVETITYTQTSGSPTPLGSISIGILQT